jgi:hypothetical protein
MKTVLVVSVTFLVGPFVVPRPGRAVAPPAHKGDRA